MFKKIFSFKLLPLVLALLPLQLSAQGDMSDVEIIPHQLTDNLYFLEGQGGNIGVSIGDDGVFLIDDQFAPLSGRILDAVASITSEPVRFVFNTHYHGDHVGGNANMADAGAIIFAHENVRDRLSADYTRDNMMMSAEQRRSLPVVTFPESMNFHLNGHDIHVFHLGPGHTDGDSFVYFTDANIIHTGDVFRTNAYPRVDTNANGSFYGIVAAYEALVDISNADTRFLPGHGVLSSQADVQSQLNMFHTISNRVKNAIAQGMSLEQILDAGLTEEYDDRWGDPTGMLTAIYSELLRM
ncbi:MAG: MBL fold metallo-hydrolase [Gammaproteobacteria bacterium]|nr:MBL fold metallo-hydrolase [Gammaproteobacteria bacterium]MAY02691.1 MBL fold metallo-hydrolase [Gammaproteobacteria bacterium]|tara:strand:+ start:1189 stop:2079 length:891 start_codon:yes stop_codon:yes gene_type:complete